MEASSLQAKLKTVVDTIETSPKLSSRQRELLYQTIYEQMQALIAPVLLKDASESSIGALSGTPTQAAIEAYGTMVLEALQRKANRDDLKRAVDRFFVEVDRVVKAQLTE